MSEGKLRVERDGPIGRMVLDNPARRNAIGGEMWRAIPKAMADFDADPAVRCVVVRGEGTVAFAAGADISEFEKNRSSEEGVRAYEQAVNAAHRAIEDISQAGDRVDPRLLHRRRAGHGPVMRSALCRSVQPVRHTCCAPGSGLRGDRHQPPGRHGRSCGRARDHVHCAPLWCRRSAGHGAGEPRPTRSRARRLRARDRDGARRERPAHDSGGQGRHRNRDRAS